jgi:hypothetical protein
VKFLDKDGKQLKVQEAFSLPNPNPTGRLAIDGDLNTEWSDGTNQALVFDFGEGGGQNLMQYTWATADDAPERDPLRWTLQGSDDASLGSWTMVDDRTLANFSVNPQRKTWLPTLGLRPLGPTPAPTPKPREVANFDLFLDEVAANQSMPDIICWHTLSSAGTDDYNPDAAYEVPRMTKALAKRGLPVPPQTKFMIDEYGGGKAWSTPTDAVWWLAQLERYDLGGCRATYCGCCVSPNMDCMLNVDASNQATGPTAIYQAYLAYANQTGMLAQVEIPDRSVITAPFDGVASADPARKWASVLVGQSNNETSAWDPHTYNISLTVTGFDKAPYLVTGGYTGVSLNRNFPADQPPVKMAVTDNSINLQLLMGGGHANDWSWIEITAPN